MPTLKTLQDAVINYTALNPELKEAHHFDFGMLLSGKVQFYVIGLTPGETDQERLKAPGSGHLNPNDPQRWAELPRNSKRWITRCKNLLRTDDLMLGDAFFWSSPNMASFKQRFGSELRNSKHLPFCVQMTNALLELYPPRAVVSLGLGHAELMVEIFGLQHVGTHPVGRWSVLHYQDGARPWFFSAHPNSYPRKGEWQSAADYIAQNSQ